MRSNTDAPGGGTIRRMMAPAWKSARSRQPRAQEDQKISWLDHGERKMALSFYDRFEEALQTRDIDAIKVCAVEL